MNRDDYASERAIVAEQSAVEREYWLHKLSGELSKSCFPNDSIGDETGERRIEPLTFEWRGELFDRLMQLSNKSDYRLLMVLTAGLALVLSRYSGLKDVIVGTPIPRQEVDGNFINTVLALRTQLEDKMSFKDVLMQARDTVDEAINNQNFPIETLLNILNLEGTDNEFPLFDVAISLENIQDRRYMEHVAPNVLFSFVKKEGSLEGGVEYNSGLYNRATIERIVGHFEYLLQQAAFNVNDEISQLEILSDDEKHQLLVRFNDNNGPFSTDKSIFQLVEDYAASTPDETALVYEGQEISYHQLNERADRLAAFLRNQGIEKDRLVGVMMHRSPEMVISILATWKAGGAYIPMDVAYPTQRVLAILEDSESPVLITTSQFVNPRVEEAYKGKIIKLDLDSDAIEAQHAAPLEPDMNRLAYVIYTSGSTGNPKGVMVEHIGMMNHIQAKVNDLKLTSSSIVAQNASHTFDISVWQFFVALVTGGKTVIYPNELVMEPERFIARLREDAVNILEVVPSYLSVLLDTLERESQPFPLLEYLLVTGEEVKVNLLKRWFERFPAIKVVNAYGPTEASDDITHHIMDKAPLSHRVPIGKPLLNFNIYIVDEALKICPMGVKGEICVSGVGVGRGYLKDQEKTDKAFMHDPFITDKEVRLYKTGDLGRWLPDGSIEFFGRKDHQVKIRGFRIELGEIECRLAEHPAVKEVVVVDRGGVGADKYLCAYIVTGNPVDASELQAYLGQQLPDYMIPAYIVELESLPLTPNGKINRKALPEPQQEDGSGVPYITLHMLNAAEATGARQGNLILTKDEQDAFIKNIETMEQREREILERHSEAAGRQYHALTYPQRMIYFAHKQYLDTGCENLVYLIRYEELLDYRRLEEAINIVLAKNEGLRLRIVELGDDESITPAQYVADAEPYKIDYVDFSTDNRGKSREQWIRENNRLHMDIDDKNLYYFAYLKFSDKESGYYMKFHHSVSDGSTTFLLSDEIHRVYRSLEKNEPVSETPNAGYLDYIREEKDYLLSPGVREDMAFWHDYLLPLPEEVDLSATPNETGSIEGKAPILPFSGHVRTLMHNYRDQHRASLYKQVLAALSIYTSRVTGIDDFVIGTLNHNRSTDVFKKTDGTFIAFLPIRMKTDRTKDFHGFVQETGQDLNHLLKNHQKYPFGVLVNELREKTGVDTSYFYNINLVGHPDLPDPGYKIAHHFPGYEPTPLSIHINFSNRDIEGVLELEWDHQVERFSDSDILQMHRRLGNILADALENPGKKLSEIEMVVGEEREEILRSLNRDDVQSPGTFELPDYFDSPVNYILNEGLCPQPDGFYGELFVGGCKPGRWEDETRRYPNPFKEGDSLYRTGQMAVRLPGGGIRLAGAVGKQAFLKGERIDMERVERCLLEDGGIREAVVIRRDNNGHRYLCAAVVSDKDLSVSRLKSELSAKIPAHMIPAQFVRLEELPMAPEGTVDLRKLSYIDMSVGMDSHYRSPTNKVEEILADTWGKVLGKECVGIDEEFFMIGGDSIKAIQIASRVKSQGFQLDVRDLFTNPTIAELAPLLSPLERISDQSTVIGDVPLTPIQADFFALSTIDRHHYNQSVMLFSQEPLEKEAITAVFSKILEHHDMLRLTVEETDVKIRQTVHGLDYPLDLESFDFSDREDGVAALESAADRIQAGINLTTGPLIKLALFHLKDGDRLLIVVHHLAMDGISWRILFEDLETLLQQYRDGVPFKLPYKTDSYKLWAERLVEYSRSDAFAAEIDYWVQSEAIPVPVIEKDFDVRENLKRDRESRAAQLSVEDTRLLLTRVNDAFGTEINDILLTALALAFKRHSGNEKVLIALEGHGREQLLEDIDITRTVGWFTSIYPVVLDASFSEDLGRQVKETKENLRRIPNKGVGYGILKYLAGEDYQQGMTFREPQISFNYLGQFDAEIEEVSFGIAGESVGKTRSQDREGEYELDVSGVIASEQLRISIEFNNRQFRPETVEALVQCYKEELCRLIGYCSSREERELTPSDLTYQELSIQEIEEIDSLLEIG